ncbi:MAG TPA: response regulator [Planctomycetota bacterium]|nr:response regulator [Planctomycetota bacterium]
MALHDETTNSDGNGTSASRRILIIEDNVDSAESLQLLLEMSGHTVHVAFRGADGVALARSFKPEIVLCDIGLPGGMDGYAVAGELRRDPATQNASLIALTGYGQVEDQQRAQQAGFEMHITKPVDPDELEKRLRNIQVRA